MQRILVIDLLQHVIRQIQAVEFPDAMIFPDRVEGVVVRLEQPEVDTVFGNIVRVLAEEDQTFTAVA